MPRSEEKQCSRPLKRCSALRDANAGHRSHKARGKKEGNEEQGMKDLCIDTKQQREGRGGKNRQAAVAVRKIREHGCRCFTFASRFAARPTSKSGSGSFYALTSMVQVSLKMQATISRVDRDCLHLVTEVIARHGHASFQSFLEAAQGLPSLSSSVSLLCMCRV